MNQSNHLITGKFGGIDKNVWITMSLLLILSLTGLFFVLWNNHSCEAFSVSIKGDAVEAANTFHTGSVVTFAASASSSENIQWSFGDHTAGQNGKEVSHVFKQAGTYFITALVSDECTETIRVTIKSPVEASAAQLSTVKDLITGPEYMEVGVAGNFTVATNAASVEWSIANEPSYPKQFSKTATYTFRKEGVFTLKVKVGNTIRTRDIHVASLKAPTTDDAGNSGSTDNMLRRAAANKGVELPEESAPVSMKEKQAGSHPEVESPGSTVIADQQFVYLLNEATRGKKDLQSFKEFLCSGTKTKVLIDKEWTTFEAFFVKIYGNKKYEIKSVQADRDADNCILKMTIKYKKRGMLGL